MRFAPAALALLLAACAAPLADDHAPGESAGEALSGRAAGVKWFGYFGSDYDEHDDSASASYVNHANVTFIRGRTQWEIEAKLIRARDRGLKAVVSLDAYVFQDGDDRGDVAANAVVENGARACPIADQHATYERAPERVTARDVDIDGFFADAIVQQLFAPRRDGAHAEIGQQRDAEKNHREAQRSGGEPRGE